jgi:methionine-rich copper-binding protein CopC
MKPFKTAAALAAIAALFAAAQAQAHARLVSSTPAEGASAPAPKQLVLTFSEKLQPKFSTARLTKNDVETPVKAVVAKDRTTMIVTPGQALTVGAYKLHWQVVTADTHKMQGDVSFTVR